MLAAFNGDRDRGRARVDAIIGSGIIPVALEFMDKPCIHACEAFAHAGYPLDAEAMLIIEVEGSTAEQDELLGRIKEICARFDPISLKVARSAEEVDGDLEGPQGRLRRGRAHQPRLSLHGRHHPDRRAALRAEAHRRDEHAVRPRVANVFHAGDGNLHPLIMFDANDPESFRKAEAFGADILKLCVEVGGCLTGEHGVGVEKRDLMTCSSPASSTSSAHQVRLRPGLAAEPAQGLPARGRAWAT
jgi:glycolate oxidase